MAHIVVVHFCIFFFFFLCKWGIGWCVNPAFIVFVIHCGGLKWSWICICLKGAKWQTVIIHSHVFSFFPFFLCKWGDWPMCLFIFVLVIHCGVLKQSWIRSCLKGSRVADIVISTFLHACVQEVWHFEAKLKNKNRTKVVVCGTWDSFRVYLMKWSWRIRRCYGKKKMGKSEIVMSLV